MVRAGTGFLPWLFSPDKGDPETFLEDPPETPAPLFAVRAFKSALFGTPHPSQTVSPSNRSRKAAAQNGLPKPPALPQDPLKTAHLEPKDREDVTQKLDLEALVSPTKGILLTPGIGTTRRKNVTFRGIGTDEKLKAGDDNRGILFGDAVSETSSSQSQAASPEENQPRQTSLTKALYKAKNGVSDRNIISSPSASKSNKRFSRDRKKDRSANLTVTEGNDLNVADDLTIDLSNPHSRSGKHWKAEFEQYHKNSGREMKKILKINQNVKSFAVRKDSEASDLREKLRRELSKVAVMESKVTDLATQLAATRTKDLKESPDQTKLVNDLARQTALAIRYKQKADNYKVALIKKNADLASETDKLEGIIPEGTGVKSNPGISAPISSDRLSQEMASLRSELDRFRSSAEATEQKAAKLEMENLALQAEINKLRQEMKMPESKRQAREEILERREGVLKVSNADRNANLPTPSTKNDALLEDVQQRHKASPTSERKTFREHDEILSNKITQDKVATGETSGSQDHSKPSKNTNTFDPESSMVDIWILGGQDDTLPLEKPRKNRDLVKPSPKVLKEITQNRILEEENRKPYRTAPNSHFVPSLENSPLSKTQTSHESPRSTISFSPKRRLLTSSGTKQHIFARQSTNTINSPRPSTLNSASNPPKTDNVSSTEKHPTQNNVINSDHQQLSKSPISGSPAQTKSTFKQNASVVPTLLPPTGTQAEAEGRKGSEPAIPMPAPPPAIDRKAAMRAAVRARMADRMAEKKKAREDKGKGA